MELQVRQEGNVTVVTVAGRLDAVTAPEYEKKARELIDSGVVRLVVDFEKVDYVSSAGLRGLLVTAKLLKPKGGQMRCANIRGNVREVFQITGLSYVFPLDDDLASALTALA